ncbi:bifunctional transcriptional activator/DNA repair enzyme AdaA [Thalassotalea maritima]|uniref:bifunctional transcriptional activator/DNA repair enzyme AdaA n=1 Tax=Thalassotalea maritima TaxID=3242416 RepID=UPI0035291D0C
MQLNAQICQQARLSRDKRFDGKFYTAVITTGIYCRPTCPAGPALEDNVRYFHTAAQAEIYGFTACKRCKPELSPNQPIEQPIGRAVNAIVTNPSLSVSMLAEQLQLSERQLQRLFQHQFGVSPKRFIRQQRLINARRLLLHSSLAIGDIAYIAGFTSQRSFNEHVKQTYRLSPRQIRQQASNTCENFVRIKLPYQGQYNWDLMLNFFRQRAITGLEVVNSEYLRAFQLTDVQGHITSHGWFRVIPITLSYCLLSENLKAFKQGFDCREWLFHCQNQLRSIKAFKTHP